LEENGKPFNEFMLEEMCQIYPDVIESEMMFLKELSQQEIS